MNPPFRLVLISNRGPYRLVAAGHGLRRERTVGGLDEQIDRLLDRQASDAQLAERRARLLAAAEGR